MLQPEGPNGPRSWRTTRTTPATSPASVWPTAPASLRRATSATRGLASFTVYEDGVAQTISSFNQEDVPVSLGIILDTSGSMRHKIDLVNKAALSFIRASNPEDQVFLVGFNDQVELLEDFTGDIEAIADSLDNIIVTGGTALYDAIYLGVQNAQTGSKPKKAIIVITDGEDRDSYYKLDELVAKVRSTKASRARR